MITGLVFGKFMPVHTGHLALIEFARKRCDRLIVSMTVTPHDSIPADLRLHWLTSLLASFSSIEVVAESDDFHDPTLPLWEATKLWAAFINRRFPDVSIFFSSEDYAIPLAYHANLQHIAFDPPRQHVPVSATQIRQHPSNYWTFIPAIVRPYFVKKICLFGPESVGKTSLAQQLAVDYDTIFVPEMARSMIVNNDFTLNDIIQIGHAQTQAVQAAEQQANRILFCDTDVITTQIYSKIYFQTVPPVLYALEHQVQYDAYVLLDIDVPWVADGLRDFGDKRTVMLAHFRNELDQRKLPYSLISGVYPERLAAIRSIANQLID